MGRTVLYYDSFAKNLQNSHDECHFNEIKNNKFLNYRHIITSDLNIIDDVNLRKNGIHETKFKSKRIVYQRILL